MAKKLTCMLAVILTLVSIFAVGVSATEYYYENFENVTPSYTSNNAHVYVTVPNLANGEPTAVYTVEDGMLHFEKSSYPQADQTAIGNKVPEVRLNLDSSAASAEEVFIEIDYMFGDNARMETGGELISYMYVHDKRFLTQFGYQGPRNYSYTTTGTATLSKNVWYTALFHVKLYEETKNNTGATVIGGVDVYNKLKTDDEYTYLQTVALETRTSNNYYLQLYGDYRKDLDIYIDNVKVYNGTVSKGGSFLMNGEKIESVDEITDGILTVETEVLCADVEAESNVFGEKKLYPVMTAFDANGRLLDCQVATDFELKAGTNEVSFNYDTSEFYEDVQGGYIGFYFWKDMTSVRPVARAIELN